MAAFIIILFVIILIVIVAANEKNKKTISQSIYDPVKPPKLVIPKMANTKGSEVESLNANNVSKVDPVIDVTGNANESIPKTGNSSLVKYEPGVPFWQHHYVYSYNEINSATNEQIKFYNYFKYQFLKGVYLDLEGNTNYAFILLFDLLDNEYNNHKNPLLLEKQLEELGYYYPRTKPYAKTFLLKKMELIGDLEGINRIKNQANSPFNYQSPNSNTEYSFTGNYWGLGTKYQSRLTLTDDQVKLLNKLPFPYNNFCSIEYCLIEVIKLFLSAIEALESKFVLEGTTLEQQIGIVQDIIAQKHFNYKPGSLNYKYLIDPIGNEIYDSIFRHCENAVRENYSHKRKISTDTVYAETEIKAELENRIIQKVKEILPVLSGKISPPDKSTEIELNAQNTNRWKIEFEQIKENHTGDASKFLSDILNLGQLNKKNPSIENIFFEASKFIAKSEKETALSLYIYYLYYDLKSATFNNRQFTGTIQKSLFKTNEQLHDFGIIVSGFLKTKDLEKALKDVSDIYVVKRKKIRLDATSIKKVQEQDSGAVELLNEYLSDEYEDESRSVKTEEVNNEEVRIEITSKDKTTQDSIYEPGIVLTDIQASALEMFVKNNDTVSMSDLEAYAKSKGVFKDQLIESINETCYENLDDILIEEDNGYYCMNKDYYQKLLVK